MFIVKYSTGQYMPVACNMSNPPIAKFYSREAAQAAITEERDKLIKAGYQKYVQQAEIIEQ